MKKYFFVSYAINYNDHSIAIENQVTERSIFDFQKQEKERRSGVGVLQVISWQEITEEEYNQYIGE